MRFLTYIVAASSIVMPVITQKTGLSKKHGLPFKMLCAFLYLITGVLSALSFGSVNEYALMILAALVLGVLGDFFLEYKGKRLFPLGVVFFAMGHIVYSATFLFAGKHKAASLIACVLGVTLAVTFVIIDFAKTKLKLKGKKNMLLIYVPVLVFSFACALVNGTAALISGDVCFGLCLMAGGSLFFMSDIMIGMGKGGFDRPAFLRNAVSYTYFAAQTLFALSILFQ